MIEKQLPTLHHSCKKLDPHITQSFLCAHTPFLLLLYYLLLDSTDHPDGAQGHRPGEVGDTRAGEGATDGSAETDVRPAGPSAPAALSPLAEPGMFASGSSGQSGGVLKIYICCVCHYI